MNQKYTDIPPEGHPLRKLGERLADYLDEDYWNECERLLIEAWTREKVLISKFLALDEGETTPETKTSPKPKRKPRVSLPPEDLVGALQDSVHRDSGKARPAKSIKVKNVAVSEPKPQN